MVILACVLAIFWNSASAQSSKKFTAAEKIEVQKQINQQVWLPFAQAYSALDDARLMELHSTDFLRVSNAGILTKSEYAAEQKVWFSTSRSNGISRTIEFRFTERIISTDHASERGVYKAVRRRNGNDERIYYGKFHVLCRKEQGVWKLLLDYDSDEQGTINEQSFRQAFGIEEFDKF